MRRAAVVLLAWGAWLSVLCAVQTPFGPRTIEFVMLGAAAAACLTGGTVLWALEAHGRNMEEPRLLAEDSFATATFVVGLALVLLGAGFGLWLILIGAGVSALGLGGLVREARARGRATGGRRSL